MLLACWSLVVEPLRERQVLAPLRHQVFRSSTALNEAIRARLERLNQRTMKGYGMSRQTLFERIEQATLTPLPQTTFVFAQWKTTKINIIYAS